MLAGRTKKGLLALGVAATLATGLSGCTFPDVGMSPGLTDEAAASSAEPTTSEKAADTVEAAQSTPARPAGDLDTGSVTHSVAAGDRSVVIDYWTAEDATSWTAAGDKTVQLSAHLEGDSTDQAVEVTRFLATSNDGTTRTTVTEDRGEFVLTPPFSYTSALVIAPSEPTATQLTLSVQFDLLVETEPGSDEWFRQTVLDTLTLPLVQEDTP